MPLKRQKKKKSRLPVGPAQRGGLRGLFDEDNHSFLKAVYRSTQAIVLTLDNKGRVVHFNPFMEKLSGWKVEEVRGKSWFATFLPKNARGKVKKVFASSIGSKRVRGNIDSMLTRDGRELKIAWWDKKISGPDGKTAGLVCVGHDVTDRSIYEDQLKAKGRLLQTVLDAVTDVIGVQRPDHTMVIYNAAGYRMLGKEPREVLGGKCHELIGRTRPCDLCATEKALKSKRTEKIERFVPEMNRWIESSSTPVLDGAGRVELVVEVLRDITSRKLSDESFRRYARELESLNTRLRGTMNDLQEKEQRLLDANDDLEKTKLSLEQALMEADDNQLELQSERARLKDILQQLSEGVIVIDKNKNVEMINERAKEILGFDPAEEIPQGYQRFLVLQLWKEMEQSKLGMVKKELKLERPREIILEVSLSHISGEAEGGFIAVMRDVTFEREVENRKSVFMANVAHEIRSPMAPMKEALGVVLEEVAGPLNEKQKKFLEMVSGNMQRLGRMVDELLDLSKMEAGRMDLKKKDVDLDSLICGVVDSIGPMAEKKCVKINSNVHIGGVVSCDPDKIQQVLYNLIVNAVKFSPERADVSVVATAGEGLARVSVSDEGPGIGKAEIGLLFDRYRQLSTSAGIKGTGLGLAISKSIIDLHGGKMWVESSPGKGSTFSFSIPIK